MTTSPRGKAQHLKLLFAQTLTNAQHHNNGPHLSMLDKHAMVSSMGSPQCWDACTLCLDRQSSNLLLPCDRGTLAAAVWLLQWTQLVTSPMQCAASTANTTH
jgi:hypothetical protein